MFVYPLPACSGNLNNSFPVSSPRLGSAGIFPRILAPTLSRSVAGGLFGSAELQQIAQLHARFM
jgi:hypothetical protein